KVYGLWDRRDGSHVVIDTGAEGHRLQATFAEFAADPASLLTATVPGQRYYRLLATTLKDASAGRSLLDGITPTASGVCRRELEPLDEPNEKLLAALKAQRHVQNLAKNPDNKMVSGDQLMGQLGLMLGKLPDDRGARAALAIANEFVRQGQWVLAREAF